MKSTSKLRQAADFLTISRIALSIPLIIALSNRFLFVAWSIILFSGFSDVADGFLARKAGGGSLLGSTLDPLADKILLSAPLIWLCSQNILPAWAIWILISRELIITQYRSGKKSGVKASILGKIKTILQFISILFLIFPISLAGFNIEIIRSIGYILFWSSFIITLSSGVDYLLNECVQDP